MPTFEGKALGGLLDALATCVILQASLDLVVRWVAGDGIVECILLSAKAEELTSDFG